MVRLAALALLAVGVLATFLVLEMTDPTGLPVDDPGEGRGGIGPTVNPRADAPPPDGSGAGGIAWWRPDVALTLGDPASSGLEGWPGDFDAAPLKAYDFDGDGTKEVVAHSNDTRVYVFSGKTGKVLAVLRTLYPPGWHVERVLNGVEAARLAPGEPPSIIVANHAASVSVWQFRPEGSSQDRFTFVKKWEKRMDAFYPQPGMDARPVVADLDGDGTGEILVQTEERGLFALKKDGSVLWQHGYGGGNAAPVVADVDDDGRLEAVFVSDAGYLVAFDGPTGRHKWSFDVSAAGVAPGSVPVAPTVADLDGRSPKEVLFTARDAHAREPERFGENHVAILAIRPPASGDKAELVWLRQPAWAHPISYTQLVVHDVNGDGSPEVLGMDWNTIGHLPGAWERLGPAHAFALTASGEDLWVRELDAWWSNKDIALGDFDGDGRLEVLANGPRDGFDGLWRLDAATGRPEAFLPVWPWKLERGPVVVDLWGKGTMQLLLPVEPLDQGREAQGAILVADLAKPMSAPWPGYPPPPRR